MDHHELRWGRVVADFLSATGAPDPCGARALAACCGLRLVPWRLDGSDLSDGRLYYNSLAPPSEQELAIRVRIAEWVLAWADEEITARGVLFVSSALGAPALGAP